MGTDEGWFVDLVASIFSRKGRSSAENRERERGMRNMRNEVLSSETSSKLLGKSSRLIGLYSVISKDAGSEGSLLGVEPRLCHFFIV